MRARRSVLRRRCRPEGTSTVSGSRNRDSAASWSRFAQPDRARAGTRRGARLAGAARRGGVRRRRCPARRFPRSRSRCARSTPRAVAGRCRAHDRAADCRRRRETARAARRRGARRGDRPSRSPHRQPLLRLRPDTGEKADREGREERCLATGSDDGEAARLAPVRRDLCDHLRSCDAEGARQARPRAHHRAHGLGNRSRVVECRRDLLEIEVSLVDASLLDRRNDRAHRRPHLAGVIAVQRVPRPDERGVRTPPERFRARHRGVDPEPAGDVVGRCHDPAAAWVATHDQRHVPVPRLFELFDRGEKRVEVEVGDDHRNQGYGVSNSRG